MAEILIDTNVFVYAYDRGEIDKQAQAGQVLDYLYATGAGRLSAQVLAEFFRATTKGVAPILTTVQARAQVEKLARTWRILDLTPQIILEATRGVCDHQLSYWDAQIWATARLYQIPVILSEDFSSGRVLEGVRFVNPFAADFVVADWA
ncbi:MAG: PIN domain-containing protein [Anaerolineae bacterium]